MASPAPAEGRRLSRAAFAGIVVVNYNGAALLRRCLESVAAQTDQDFELVVVDNGSEEPWEPAVPEALRPRLRAVRNAANEGFGRACNQGARAAASEWLVFLNNDAVASPDFLASLRAEAVARPEYGMFAALVAIESFPGFVDSAGIGVFLDGMARCRGWQEPMARYAAPAEVLGPVWSAAAVRRDVFEDLGGVEESYFLYLEDLDFALRARWRGHRCLFSPRLRAAHDKSSTAGKHTAQKAYHVERNHVWVAAACFPAPLLALAPFYTAYRYVLQAYAAWTHRGITSAFVRSYDRRTLARVLAGAYRDAFAGMPAAWRARRAVMAGRRITAARFLRDVLRFRLSWREFAFKD